MLKCNDIFFRNFKTFILIASLAGITIFSFATIGGDKNKSKSASLNPGFSLNKTVTGFSLRSGASFKGSVILKEQRTADYITYTSLTTYQKGNTTYILPNKYRVSLESQHANSSLQLLNVRFKLCK